jgi:uncharacterized protein with FMN-binding domain
VVSDSGVGVRRIVLAVGTTAAGLVLLLSLPTSSSSAVRPSSTLTSAAAGVTTGQAYDGAVTQTEWGPVQVRITVSAGKVVGATAVQVPNGNRRDAEINGYAVPILNQEAVSTGTAAIDTVSGATITSNGYITSLQAAIDAAGLA